MKQAKTLMMNAIQKELDGRLHDSECRNCHLAIAHTDNEEAALEFKKESKSASRMLMYTWHRFP